MKCKYIVIFLVTSLCLTNLYAQGPIYNFNFFNKEGKVDQNQSELSQGKIVGTPESQAAENKTVEEKITGPMNRSSLISPSSPVYVYGSFLRGGHEGPSNKQSNYEILRRGDYEAWAHSYNETSYILSENLEAGLGIPFNNRIFLVGGFVHKAMRYHYAPEYAAHGGIKYKGSAYGGKVGIEVPIALNNVFDFTLASYASMLKGSLDHPAKGNNIPNETAKYSQVGMEFKAGIDFKFTRTISLGAFGQYGAYNIKVKDENARMPQRITDMVEREEKQLGVGAQLKLFI